ncbi:MAG: hypothetical protein M0Z58_02660 [Nitrospiraceae bacterium]|nr:hypothetical protein [Nitrospiraceae bacterium]
MEIEDIRRIGRRVYERVRATGVKGQGPLERGAGGDRMFPVDRLAEEIILEGLRGLGRRFHVVSEEAGVLEIEGGGGTGPQGSSPPLLIAIDPVDGSKNAVAGIPFFSSSIAVCRGEELKDLAIGYVINLVTGDEFWAAKGQGVFLNGQPVTCQGGPGLKLAVFEASSPARHLRRILPLLEGAAKTRCLGSIALDLALVASGAASLFVSPAPSRSFDYAAGYLLVKEAGGVFTDMEGKDLDGQKIGLERGASLLASANPEIHRAALKALAGNGR